MRIRLLHIVLAGVLGALGTAQANEIAEREDNHPIGSAQEVTFSGDSVAIRGFVDNVGCRSFSDMRDVDFYKFYAQDGDVVTLDIDYGFGGETRVDLEIALFQDGSLRMLDRNEDVDPNDPLDEGSTIRFDPRIDEYAIDETGFYIVGVTSDSRDFTHGGLALPKCAFQNKGDYVLVISGVTSPIVHINIELRPNDDASETEGVRAKSRPDKRPALNHKSKGKIPVALLSSFDFEPTLIDQESLRFGRTGAEASPHRCPRRKDINGDGRLDLVCLFDLEVAGFGPDDTSAFVSGQTVDGKQFEGRTLYDPVPRNH